MNSLDFTGKVALATGAGSGMGLVTANAFAEAGAAVAFADVRGGKNMRNTTKCRSDRL